MRVNQEDYEDKLTQINQLNRRVKNLVERIDTTEEQRNAIMDCLLEVVEVAEDCIEHESYILRIRDAVARARAIMKLTEIT